MYSTVPIYKSSKVASIANKIPTFIIYPAMEFLCERRHISHAEQNKSSYSYVLDKITYIYCYLYTPRSCARHGIRFRYFEIFLK